jgi:hypothetical protein
VILSQFSLKNKATADSTEDAADKAAFKDLNNPTNEEDDDMEADGNDDNDELEPSVEASDNAMVDVVAAEVEEDDSGDVAPLTRAEVNLGHFAITKVWLQPCTHYWRTHLLFVLLAH